MERAASVDRAREWLTGQGFAAGQIANIEAALNREGCAPEQWLGTLRGVDVAELQQIAQDSPEPRTDAQPEPMMEDARDGEGDADGGGDAAELQHESSLSRQHSARTEEFLNHRRKEAERSQVRMQLHRAKVGEFGEGPIVRRPCQRFSVGLSDTIGHRRSMEDCMTLCGGFRGNEDEDFFAVFDGHGGQSVAEFCAIHAPRVVEQALALNPPGSTATAIFPTAFRALNEEIQKELGEEGMECGSTAVIAVVTGEQLSVANVGDSRAVLEYASRPCA